MSAHAAAGTAPPAKVAFVHNFATHYTQRTFELLAQRLDADFYFFSAGGERYWLKEHGVRTGQFHAEYLPGFQFGRTRIAISLPYKLLAGNHDLVVKCINGRFALPVTYLAARLRRKPFVLWTGVWMRLKSPFHRILFPVVRYIYRHSDAIVAYGEHVKRYLVSEGVDAERIFVAPHAVDNTTYGRTVPESATAALRETLGISSGTKIVLFLGRLDHLKGLSYLIEAFASIGNGGSVLVLAGTGPDQAALERLARDLHIDHKVRFPGYVPVDQSIVYYAASSVLVLPSISTATWREPWGLVVNEAFNQALPVIATDAVGAAAGGLVQNGVTGSVVPERNSAALGAAIACMLEDEQLRRQLGSDARRRIQSWTQERMADHFEEAMAYALRTKTVSARRA